MKQLVDVVELFLLVVAQSIGMQVLLLVGGHGMVDVPFDAVCEPPDYVLDVLEIRVFLHELSKDISDSPPAGSTFLHLQMII